MRRVEGVPRVAVVALREAAKAHLRVEGGAEDTLIEGYATAAFDLFERFAGLLAIRREAVETIVGDGTWRRLRSRPVAAISAAVPIAIDIDGDGEGLVRVAAGVRVEVTAVAGLAETLDALPGSVRHGLVRLTAHVWTHRDGAEAAIPQAVAALWTPWRRVRIG